MNEKDAERRAARREQILAAAGRVFAQKGYHAATIRQIAREAGLADGTIYLYFGSKTALLLGLFDRMRDIVLADTDPAALIGGDVRTFLAGYIRVPLRAMEADHFELLRVVLSEILVNAELRTLYAENVLAPTMAMAEAPLRAFIDRGAIRPVDVPLTLRILSGMVLGLIIQRILGDPILEAHWEILPEMLADQILRGTGGDGA